MASTTRTTTVAASQQSPTNSMLSPRGPTSNVQLSTFSPKRGYRSPAAAAAAAEADSSDDELASTLHQLRRIGSTLVKRVTDVELDDDSHSSRALTPMRRRSECGGFATVDLSPDATTRWRKKMADGGAAAASGTTTGRRASRPVSERADRARLQLVKLKDVQGALPSSHRVDDAVSSRSGGRSKRSASLVSSIGAGPVTPRSLLASRDGTVDGNSARRGSLASVHGGNNSTRVSRRGSVAAGSPLAASFRFGDGDAANRVVVDGVGGGKSVSASRRGSTSSYREYTEKQLVHQPALRRLRNVQSKVHMAESILYSALAESSDQPPRSAADRKRDAVELEKAKLVLFVGRKFNLEERITTLLGVIEEQQKVEAGMSPRRVSSADRAKRFQPRTVTEAVKELDALVLDDHVGTSRKQDRLAAARLGTASSEHHAASAAPALNPMAISTTSTVASNAPVQVSDNFNPARLRRLIDRFSSELEQVERHVEPGAEEAVTKMRQDLHIDTYSNFKDLCWLIESLDSIFLSDDPTTATEETAALATTTSATAAAAVPSPQAAQQQRRRTTGVPPQAASATARPSVFITGTEGVVDGSEQASFSRPSLNQTLPSSRDPSLVPFSLYSSQLDVRPDGVVSLNATGPAPAPRLSTTTRRRETHLQHLQLLGFMAEAVPESYFEALEAQQQQQQLNAFGRRAKSTPPSQALAGHTAGTSKATASSATTAGSGWPQGGSPAGLYGGGGGVDRASHGRGESTAADDSDNDGDDEDDGSRRTGDDASHGRGSTRSLASASGTSNRSNGKAATAASKGGASQNTRGPRGSGAGADARAAAAAAATKAAATNALAHIRHDLLDDLKKLYKVFDYNGLVVQRREEVVDANAKSQEDYVAEMEAKLQQQMERRQQALAAAVAARGQDDCGLASLGGAPSSAKGRPGTHQSGLGRQTPTSASGQRRPEPRMEGVVEDDLDDVPPVDILVLDSDNEDGEAGLARHDDEARGGDGDGAAGPRPPADASGTPHDGERAEIEMGRYTVFEETLPCGLTFSLFGEYAPGTRPDLKASRSTTGASAAEAPHFGQYLLQVQNNGTEPVDASVTVLANKLKTVQIDAAWSGVRKAGIAYCVRVPPSCVRRLITFVPDSKATAKKAGGKAKKNAKKSAAPLVAPPPGSAFVFDVIDLSQGGGADGDDDDDEHAQGPDAAYKPLVSGGGARLAASTVHDLDDVDSADVSSHSTPRRAPAAATRVPAKPAPTKPPLSSPATTATTTASKAKPKGKSPAMPAVPSRPENKLATADTTGTVEKKPAVAAEPAPAPDKTEEEADKKMLAESPLNQFVFPQEPPAVEDWGTAHPVPTVEAMENNCVVLSVLQSEALAQPQTAQGKESIDASLTAAPGALASAPSKSQKAVSEAVTSVLDALQIPEDAPTRTSLIDTPQDPTRSPSLVSPASHAALTPEAVAEAVMAKLTAEAWQETEAEAATNTSRPGTAISSRPSTGGVPVGVVPPRLSDTSQHSGGAGTSAKDVAERLVTALSNSALRHNSLGSGNATTGAGWLPSPTIVLSSSSSHPLVSTEDVRPYGTVGGIQFDPDVAEADEAARRRQSLASALNESGVAASKAGLPRLPTPASAGRQSPTPPIPAAPSRPVSGSSARVSPNPLYGSEIIQAHTESSPRPASASSSARLPVLLDHRTPEIGEAASTTTTAAAVGSGSDAPPRVPHRASPAPSASASLPPITTAPAATSTSAKVVPRKKSPATKPLVRVPPPLPAPRYQLTSSADAAADDGDEEAIKNLLRGPVAPPPIVTTQSADTGALNVFLPPDAERMGLYDALLHSNKNASKKAKPKAKPKAKKNADRKGASSNAYKLDGDDDETSTQLPGDGDTVTDEEEEVPAFVSNVKNFLNKVAHTTDVMGDGGAGGRGGGGAHLSSSVPVTATVAGAVTAAVAAPVFSELQFLEEQARELYRQDPLRYDTVMDDLIKKAMAQMSEVAKEDAAAAAAAAAAAKAKAAQHARVAPGPEQSANSNGSSHRQSVPMTAITFDLEHGGHLDGSDARGAQRGKRSTLPGRHASVVMLGASDTADGASSMGSYTRGSRLASSVHAADATSASNAALTRVSDAELSGEARKGGLADIEAGKDEVQTILYEQMKAKLMLRAIIAQMQKLWATKEAEKDARAKEAMRRAFERAADISWEFEKHRVVNLHKLIHLLDRRVGRVHGWIPMYDDTNVLTDARGFSEPSMDVTSYPNRFAATYGGPAVSRSAFGRSALVLCAPQLRLRHAMCLAKRRRLLPVRLLRQQIGEEWNQHLLFGYKKHVLPAHDAHHPQRRQLGRGEPWRPPQFSDMESTGERMRYRRRLQGAAPFQSSSKMYSPRLKRDQELPFPK